MTSSSPGSLANRLTPMRRAIGTLAGKAVILVHNARPWSSITFSGARHMLALSFVGADAVAEGERLLLTIADTDLALPGQLVADIIVTTTGRCTSPQPQLDLELDILLIDVAPMANAA